MKTLVYGSLKINLDLEPESEKILEEQLRKDAEMAVRDTRWRRS